MKRIVLMGVPHHENIGDSAIAYAEKKFLKENVKNYERFYIPEETMEKCAEKLVTILEKDDIICMHGGGNIGSQYPIIERSRRKVISLFPNNKIIVFPQTIYFEDSEFGRQELEESKKAYEAHKNLTLVAREEESYEIMKKAFPSTEILLTPDIVMYLDKTEPEVIRDGILMVFRNDVEAKIIKEEKKELIKIIRKNYQYVKYTDTINEQNQGILEIEKEKVLEKTFARFRSSELVLTDRLHGMVFAAITSTPCIALGNYNHKVKGTARWLKHLKYIKYADSIEEVEKYLEELKNIRNCRYDNAFAKEKLNKIVEKIYQ